MYVKNITETEVRAPFVAGGIVASGASAPCIMPLEVLAKDPLFLTMTGIAKYADPTKIASISAGRVPLASGYALHGKVDGVFGLYIPSKFGAYIPNNDPVFEVIPTNEVQRGILRGLAGKDPDDTETGAPAGKDPDDTETGAPVDNGPGITLFGGINHSPVTIPINHHEKQNGLEVATPEGITKILAWMDDNLVDAEGSKLELPALGPTMELGGVTGSTSIAGWDNVGKYFGLKLSYGNLGTDDYSSPVVDTADNGEPGYTPSYIYQVYLWDWTISEVSEGLTVLIGGKPVTAGPKVYGYNTLLSVTWEGKDDPDTPTEEPSGNKITITYPTATDPETVIINFGAPI